MPVPNAQDVGDDTVPGCTSMETSLAPDDSVEKNSKCNRNNEVLKAYCAITEADALLCSKSRSNCKGKKAKKQQNTKKMRRKRATHRSCGHMCP
jgi:hypothetical protein